MAEDVGLAYIRGRYQVPARRGGRIQFAYPEGTVRTGVIVGSSDAHLLVDFPGQRGAVLHPTWKVTYLSGGAA